MLLFGVTIPAPVPQRSEIPEGLMNYPVQIVHLLTRAEVANCSHLKLPLFQELNVQIIQEHTRHEADLLRTDDVSCV